MKKTLFTSLFCGALVVSSLANFARNNTKQAPKINKPNEKMIITPIEGGGGGSSTPVYSETEGYSYGSYNDFSKNPTFAGNYGKITGKLVRHNEDERMDYGVPEADVDWFRFSITEKYNYSFSFTAPNTNYYFELYRFGSNSTSYNSDNHILLYSSRTSSRNYQTTLMPATYFIRVTTQNVNAVSSTNYTLEYSKNSSFPNDTQSLVLTDQVFSNTGIVLWENENVPQNMDRWNEQNQTLALYTQSSGTQYTFYKGYLDPNFMEYSSGWTQGGLLSPDGRYTLDSIMYIGGTKALTECKDILYKLMNDVSISQYSDQIASMRLEAVANGVDAATGIVNLVITVILASYAGPLAVLAETVVGRITVMATCVEVAVALAKALSFVNNDNSHLVTGYDIGNNLRNLYERCKDILEGSAPDKYLRIPKYSYFYIGRDYYNGTTSMNAMKVATTLFRKSPYLYTDDYFFAPKNYIVTRNQTNIDGRLLKGKISRYVDFEDFWDKTNPVTYSFGSIAPSTSDLEYEIVERKNGHWYLNVYNPCWLPVPITFSTTDVTSVEAQYFNLTANAYGRNTVYPGETVSIDMEDRVYVYLREYSDNRVRKYFVHSDGYTTFAGTGLTNFGMEFLKISVVKKVGSTWTIRIRNVYTQGITAYYNYKMCNEGDARSWSGLRHIASVYIPCDGDEPYADVQISENGWVRFITMSHTIGNVRYVSYAKGLSSSATPVDYYTNTIYLY